MASGTGGKGRWSWRGARGGHPGGTVQYCQVLCRTGGGLGWGSDWKPGDRSGSHPVAQGEPRGLTPGLGATGGQTRGLGSAWRCGTHGEGPQLVLGGLVPSWPGPQPASLWLKCLVSPSFGSFSQEMPKGRKEGVGSHLLRGATSGSEVWFGVRCPAARKVTPAPLDPSGLCSSTVPALPDPGPGWDRGEWGQPHLVPAPAQPRPHLLLLSHSGLCRFPSRACASAGVGVGGGEPRRLTPAGPVSGV